MITLRYLADITRWTDSQCTYGKKKEERGGEKIEGAASWGEKSVVI